MQHEHPESLLHRGLFRQSPPERSAEPKPAEIKRQHRGPGLPPIDFETHKDWWMEMLRLAHEEFPYCTMYGVHVVDGAIRAYERIQECLAFGAQQSVPHEILLSMFDAPWQALEALCISMGTGRLVELKFHAARPVIAITEKGGRRFQGLIKKHSKK